MEDCTALYGHVVALPGFIDEGCDSEGMLEEAYSTGSMLSRDSLQGLGVQVRHGELMGFGEAPASPAAASEWGLEELGGSEASDVVGEVADDYAGHESPHPGGLVLDLEQMLQRLLVEEGLIDGRGRALPQSARSGPQSVGALGAQATLLGGTLFSYESCAASPKCGGDLCREHEAHRHGPVVGLSACGASPVHSARRPVVPHLMRSSRCGLGRSSFDPADESTALQTTGRAASFAATPSASSFGTARGSVHSGSFGGATARSTLSASSAQLSEARRADDELRLIAAQQQVQSSKEASALASEAASAAASARGAAGSARGGSSASEVRSRAEDELRLIAAHQQLQQQLQPEGSRGVAIPGVAGDSGSAWPQRGLLEDQEEVDDDDDDDDDEGVFSVVEFGSEASPHSSPNPSARAAGAGRIGGHLSARSQQRQEEDPLDRTSSTWDLDGTIRSAASTSRGSNSLQHSARTVTGELQDPAGDLEISVVDGELAGLLQHLALNDASFDESLARSVQRVIQLGTVLAGERLTDEEIQALPKVRFQSAEQQSCPICLEAYSQGELLTALRCSHCFHVECLARWFRHSSQCPLCRSQCND